jgi:hypothetical protein
MKNKHTKNINLVRKQKKKLYKKLAQGIHLCNVEKKGSDF